MLSKSSIEAKCRGIAHTVTETLWVQYVLTELGLVLHEPYKWFVVYLYDLHYYQLVLHDHSKHIKVDYHFVCERVSHNNLVVTDIPIQLHPAYIFIEAFPTN